MNSSEEILKQQIGKNLDAMQRTTILIITIGFTVYLSTKGKIPLQVVGVVIPNDYVLYISSILLLFLFWQLSRISSKLYRIVKFLPIIDFETKIIFYSHHLILNPFESTKSTNLRIVDSVIMGVLFFCAGYLGHSINYLVNNTTALTQLAKIFPFWVYVPLTYSVSIINCAFVVNVVINFSNIARLMGFGTMFYTISSFGIGLLLAIIVPY